MLEDTRFIKVFYRSSNIRFPIYKRGLLEVSGNKVKLSNLSNKQELANVNIKNTVSFAEHIFRDKLHPIFIAIAIAIVIALDFITARRVGIIFLFILMTKAFLFKLHTVEIVKLKPNNTLQVSDGKSDFTVKLSHYYRELIFGLFIFPIISKVIYFLTFPGLFFEKINSNRPATKLKNYIIRKRTIALLSRLSENDAILLKINKPDKDESYWPLKSKIEIDGYNRGYTRLNSSIESVAYGAGIYAIPLAYLLKVVLEAYAIELNLVSLRPSGDNEILYYQTLYIISAFAIRPILDYLHSFYNGGRGLYPNLDIQTAKKLRKKFIMCSLSLLIIMPIAYLGTFMGHANKNDSIKVVNRYIELTFEDVSKTEDIFCEKFVGKYKIDELSRIKFIIPTKEIWQEYKFTNAKKNGKGYILEYFAESSGTRFPDSALHFKVERTIGRYCIEAIIEYDDHNLRYGYSNFYLSPTNDSLDTIWDN
jgi:hypothetical protein